MQRFPSELVQVRGTDVAAALRVRAARRLNPRRRELVKKQGGEARILGTARDSVSDQVHREPTTPAPAVARATPFLTLL